jgi:DNA-3-methyladenine glycosylase II
MGVNGVKVQDDVVVDEEPKPLSVRYIAEFQRGLDHCVNIDPSLRAVVERATFKSFVESSNQDIPRCFDYLVRGVVAQQVSGAAARSILKKFQRFFQGEETCDEDLVMPTPQQILSASVDELRGTGLSYRKAEYIQGLARAFDTKEITDEWLRTAPDDDVVDKIVSLKGFGRKLLLPCCYL